MLQTPAHGSLPSGHASESFMIAHVLSTLASEKEETLYGDRRVLREQLMRQAARIATNRVVAGVHFPIDSAAGQMLGLCLGEYLLARCTGGTVTGWTFRASAFGEQDFLWTEIEGAFLDDCKNGACKKKTECNIPGYLHRSNASFDVAAPPENDPLEWLWRNAHAEWSAR